jgi:Fe-Mn family superoxide dismutase
VNHDLFFQNLAPATRDASGAIMSGRSPSESSHLALAITRDFGSFAAFKTKFTSLAMGVFGSGWVFLHVDSSSGALKLAVTANQDNPAILAQDAENVALMCLDVWEHAYYMDYTNKRAEFVEAWWNIIGQCRARRSTRRGRTEQKQRA